MVHFHPKLDVDYSFKVKHKIYNIMIVYCYRDEVFYIYKVFLQDRRCAQYASALCSLGLIESLYDSIYQLNSGYIYIYAPVFPTPPPPPLPHGPRSCPLPPVVWGGLGLVVVVVVGVVVGLVVAVVVVVVVLCLVVVIIVGVVVVGLLVVVVVVVVVVLVVVHDII